MMFKILSVCSFSSLNRIESFHLITGTFVGENIFDARVCIGSFCFF